MSQITITDEAVLARLAEGNSTVTVRDPSGKVCGYITPLRPSDLQPPISDEEIARRLDNRGTGHTTEDMLQHLKGLKKGQ